MRGWRNLPPDFYRSKRQMTGLGCRKASMIFLLVSLQLKLQNHDDHMLITYGGFVVRHVFFWEYPATRTAVNPGTHWHSPSASIVGNRPLNQFPRA